MLGFGVEVKVLGLEAFRNVNQKFYYGEVSKKSYN